MLLCDVVSSEKLFSNEKIKWKNKTKNEMQKWENSQCSVIVNNFQFKIYIYMSTLVADRV